MTKVKVFVGEIEVFALWIKVLATQIAISPSKVTVLAITLPGLAAEPLNTLFMTL